MEIEGEDGSRTQLKEDSELVFGRGNGFSPNDPTVSRRHILFQLKPPRVSFQVIGKNPIWVRLKEGSEIKAFRRSERGELSDGDLFCASSNDPVWFSVKKVNDDDETEIMTSSSTEETKLGDELGMEVSSKSELSGKVQDLDLGFDLIDVSKLDPVKEFGFLVIGHEFDNYPKGKIRDVKSWNWYLEDYREASTDDEDDTGSAKGKKALSRKRKKKNVKDEDDEEWAGESEEEEAVAKSTGLGTSKYSIRSKEHGKGRPKKDSSTQKGSAGKRSKRAEDEEEDDEEEEGDETLGGFIVEDDDVEGEDEDDEDEEEFEEDEFDE